jgi:exosome complex exonuclease RRP6
VSTCVLTPMAVDRDVPSNRPLPQEMLYYARSDTHFLLFIYDNVRSLLLNRADGPESLQKVLDASSRTSLQVYSRETYDVEEGSGVNGWGAFLAKFSNQGAVGIEADRRTAVVVAVHVWRDRVARELDESPAYVFPMSPSKVIDGFLLACL